MDIQTISIVIAAISVVIGVISSILSNRKAEQQRQTEIETRQAELFTNIYNRWNTRDIQTAYGHMRHLWQWDGFEDFNRKYQLRPPGSAENFERWFDYQILLTYFEGLGVLVQQGLVDITLVEVLFADRILWFWEDVTGPLMVESRKRFDAQMIPGYHPSAKQMYHSIEYLYNELKKREQPPTASA